MTQLPMIKRQHPVRLTWIVLFLVLLTPTVLLAQVAKNRPVLVKKTSQPVVLDPALSPQQMAIAQLIEVGVVPCDAGTSVTLTAVPQAPGYFDVQVKHLKYRMSPVETSTGAIRLEDRKAGAVWLQLANKSMLMNQKLGQRLADSCLSSSQVLVAQALAIAPLPSLLDAAPSSPVVSPQFATE
jgi:hypothetical protein